MLRLPPLRHLFPIIAVLLTAAFFYLHHLNAVSFWEDESWLAIAVDDTLADVYTFSVENGVHPPLYFYMAWFYVRLAGNSEFALRWLGGMISLIGLALVYPLGKALYGSYRAGCFAVLLAAGSIYLVYLTRLARQYTLFFTLVVLVMLAYQRWRQNPAARNHWLVALCLAQTALLYTQYFGGLLIPVTLLHGTLTLPRKHLPKLFAAFIVCSLLFALWGPSLQAQIANSPPGGIGYAIRDNLDVLKNLADRFSNGHHVIGGVLLLIGMIGMLIQRRWQTVLLLFLWIVPTLGAILWLNVNYLPIYIDRNMMYLFPAVMLMYGGGLAWLTQPIRIPAKTITAPVTAKITGYTAALLLAGLFIGHGLLIYDIFWQKTTDWRSPAQVIAQDARPEDVFVLAGDLWSLDYYMRRYMGARLALHRMEDWIQSPVGDDRIWLIDERLAVNFDAIDALPTDLIQTRRIVYLPVVAEFYQRPPQQIDTVFGEQIGLSTANIPEALTLLPGDRLQVDLWWQALRPPMFDYSTSMVIIGENGVLAQQDRSFDDGRLNATALLVHHWQPDTRTLNIPDTALPGKYTVFITIYDWRTGERLPPTGQASDNLYPLLDLQIRSP